MMTDILVRRLLIDLEKPLARRWHGGDAFRTAFFNALSMSFPSGEQFFIDSVRAAFSALPSERQAALKKELQGFIGQEATHRRIHQRFNAHLEQQGLSNIWEPRVLSRMKELHGTDPRHGLAATAANEHLTAIFANWVLAHPEWFEACERRLTVMWMWHCSEELEHKSTAFNLYLSLGGNHAWRITWFRRMTIMFFSDLLKQTLANLRHDDALWKVSTWKSAMVFLFGGRGLVRQCLTPWWQYFRADFHPAENDDALAHRWLSANVREFVPVLMHDAHEGSRSAFAENHG